VSARHKGRKRALDLLYAADLRDVSLSDLIAEETSRAADEPARESSWSFAREILEGMVSHSERVDELIRDTSSWPMDRMPGIDRALLRMAVCELIIHSDIPEAVIIAEAGDLAGEFSTEDSRGFVQGVLGAIVGKVRPS
jgi:N utilization substance protein B